MTLTIQQDYTIEAGRTINAVDQTAIILNPKNHENPPSLFNYGTINVTFHSNLPTYAILCEAGPFDGAVFWNESSGVIRMVNVATEEGYGVAGFSGITGMPAMRNDGSFEVSSVNGYATAISGAPSLENNGELIVSGLDEATGYYTVDGDLTNTGEMLITAGHDASAYIAHASGSVLNTGLIQVQTTDGQAIGLQMSLLAGDTVVNKGVISVTDQTGAFDSIGIEITHGDNQPVTVKNTGSITADAAFLDLNWDPSYPAVTTLANSGDIHGRIDMGLSGDTVDNTGSITGDVLLGDGDDLYDGVHGKLRGGIEAGGGADTVNAGAEKDSILGDTGDDLLHGGKGGDFINGGHDQDGLFGGAGDDHLQGDYGLDLLSGDKGADLLEGGGDNDTLIGGKGSDVLTGGAGADDFVFRTAKEFDASRPDLITDLEAQDVIDLSGVDADATVAKNQAFVRVEAFGGHAGELTVQWDAGAGATFVRMDTNGDGQADLTIQLTGDHTADISFVL